METRYLTSRTTMTYPNESVIKWKWYKYHDDKIHLNNSIFGFWRWPWLIKGYHYYFWITFGTSRCITTQQRDEALKKSTVSTQNLTCSFYIDIKTREKKFLTLLPSRHLLVQSQQWNHQNNMENLFKANDKGTRTISLTSLWCLYY